MTRKYEDVKETVTHAGQCTRVVCDMCGSKAERPELDEMCWEWGGAGLAGGVIEFSRSIDGDYFFKRLDLCPECTEWLMRAVGGSVKRPKNVED